MTHIEPLESRIQFAGDPTVPLGADWQISHQWSTYDTARRQYTLSDMTKPLEGQPPVRKLVIFREKPDGSLDTSFSESGYKVLDRQLLGESPLYEPHISVDQSSRAYIVDGPLLWRLTPGGRADQAFGRRGKIVIPLMISDPVRSASGVAFDASNRAYVGGSSQGKSGTRMTVIRLSDVGAIDFSWWAGAYKSPVHASQGSSDSIATLLKFLPDGKLMVAGQFHTQWLDDGFPNGGQKFPVSGGWVTRLNPDDRSVDATYGVGGYAEKAYFSQDVAWGTAKPLQIAGDGSVPGVSDINTDNRENPHSEEHWKIAPNGTVLEGDAADRPTAQYFGRNIRAARTTAARFTVIYHDGNGVDPASLDSRDIRVFGPFDGEMRNKFAALESVQGGQDGTLAATYHIASADGWTSSDNGTYTVLLNEGQVKDFIGVSAVEWNLGTFLVRIA